MLVALVLAVALCLSLLTGGRFRYIEQFQLKALPLGVGAFLMQLLMFTAQGEVWLGNLLPVVYMFSLAALMIFLLVNWRITGVPFLLAGLMLNILVISANGGYMPVNPTALIATGQAYQAARLVRDGVAANCVLMSGKTHFNILADHIVLPLVGSMGSAYSIGDLIALAGEAMLVWGMIRPVRRARRSAAGKS